MYQMNPFAIPPAGCDPEGLSDKLMAPLTILADQVNAINHTVAGFSKYVNDFLLPFVVSTQYFRNVESERMITTSPWDSFQSYLELLEFNYDLSSRNFQATLRAINDYGNQEMKRALEAIANSLTCSPGENVEDYVSRQARMLEMVSRVYPQAIADIEPEYGFHFERGRDELVAETDRFLLYQVMPTDPSVTVNPTGKPILIVPPYVLGANILGFLPGENRSYTHCFANQGIPTYIRILKDIQKTPALQTMTGEDDTRDTAFFCDKIIERQGKPVTLNGYCQGGYMAVCNLLTGELDDRVDALLTCVSPMDGTRSTGLKDFLTTLPPRFNDLAYGTKTLPNGNQVADGLLMGWVYKLKSIESETPMVSFFRDMMMLRPKNDKPAKISKTAAALNYWLANERTDLPLCITEMSFASYNIPISEDGTLPVKLFGRSLNFKRIAEKEIPWLICYGERDDLVEKETALAPADFIDVEISPFPKGHVAIATSWSDPRSEFALHTRFGENKQYRGPVRFQLDLDRELSGEPSEQSSGESPDA